MPQFIPGFSLRVNKCGERLISGQIPSVNLAAARLQPIGFAFPLSAKFSGCLKIIFIQISLQVILDKKLPRTIDRWKLHANRFILTRKLQAEPLWASWLRQKKSNIRLKMTLEEFFTCLSVSPNPSTHIPPPLCLLLRIPVSPVLEVQLIDNKFRGAIKAKNNFFKCVMVSFSKISGLHQTKPPADVHKPQQLVCSSPGGRRTRAPLPAALQVSSVLGVI